MNLNSDISFFYQEKKVDFKKSHLIILNIEKNIVEIQVKIRKTTTVYII